MGPMEIVLIVLIGVMMIGYIVMSFVKNKKDRQKMQEMTNSFKRGDKVMTASGVYGTIVDLHQDGDKKIVTIETGAGAHKGYISLDALAIYQVLSNETAATPVDEAAKEEEQKPEQAEPSDSVADIETAVTGKKSRKKKEEK